MGGDILGVTGPGTLLPRVAGGFVNTADRTPTAASTLGEFLSSRRAAVEPAAVGMLSEGYRRVAGLRREEVAVLAGVSVDYYTRLEQGRELHPSPQILDALGRTLMLEDDAREHLYRLAGAMPLMRDFATSRDVSPELLRLLAELHQSPALILNHALDVLARNELWRDTAQRFRDSEQQRLHGVPRPAWAYLLR